MAASWVCTLSSSCLSASPCTENRRLFSCATMCPGQPQSVVSNTHHGAEISNTQYGAEGRGMLHIISTVAGALPRIILNGNNIGGGDLLGDNCFVEASV